MSNMFSGRDSFPIPGFMKVALAVWVVCALSAIGGFIALIVWLFTHVHLGGS